jgi:hypothetical protein
MFHFGLASSPCAEPGEGPAQGANSLTTPFVRKGYGRNHDFFVIRRPPRPRCSSPADSIPSRRVPHPCRATFARQGGSPTRRQAFVSAHDFRACPERSAAGTQSNGCRNSAQTERASAPAPQRDGACPERGGVSWRVEWGESHGLQSVDRPRPQKGLQARALRARNFRMADHPATTHNLKLSSRASRFGAPSLERWGRRSGGPAFPARPETSVLPTLRT